MFFKMRDELTVTKDDIPVVTGAISSAKNNLMRTSGYSPAQHVFGATPNLPEDLVEGPHARDPGDEPVICDKHARDVAIRTAARVAYHQVQTDERVRRALAGRARVQDRTPEVGEQVFYWRKAKTAKRGCWVGPATVIGLEGTNVWVTRAGRCTLCAAEHIRPATSEELGQAFSLRAAREDLDRLLNLDDADEEMFDDEVEAEGPNNTDVEFDVDDEDLAFAELDVEDGGPPGRDGRHHRRRARVAPYVLQRYRGKEPPRREEEAMMMKRAKTVRSREKQLEKEIPWAEIPEAMRPAFRTAEIRQWQEHQEHHALTALTVYRSPNASGTPSQRKESSRRGSPTATSTWARGRQTPMIPPYHGSRKPGWWWEDTWIQTPTLASEP